MNTLVVASGDAAERERMVEHRVFGQFLFLTTRLPEPLAQEADARFEELWTLHPAEFYEMRQPGTGATIPVPRWQQAYGRDYRYSGNVNRALPTPAIVEPFLAWAQSTLDARLNGFRLNWYDAGLAHRIATASSGWSRERRSSPSRWGRPAYSGCRPRVTRALWISRPRTAACSCCRGRPTGTSSTVCRIERPIRVGGSPSRCERSRRRGSRGTRTLPIAGARAALRLHSGAVERYSPGCDRGRERWR
jgi:hypothetical protein